MNTFHPDPLDDSEDMPMMPSGELPDMDDLPPDEPSGPPAATNDPFGASLLNSSAPRVPVPPANPPRA